MQQIIEFFGKMFDSSDWPPRWHCGRWTDFHGWLYIVSDLLIWSAYFTIPLVIMKYITRKHDLRFVKLYFLFAAFILACGTTHFLDAAAFWAPIYRFNALIRLITGVLSWLTVYYLIKFLPVAFTLKSQQQLETEIAQRIQAEERIRQLNLALEQRVTQRTEELRILNEKLEERVRQRTLQLEAANKEMEAFSYSISHDLRAPLRGISGFTSLLEERLGPDLDQESQRIAGVIRKNTRKMGRLIDDLLTFSRTGRQDMFLTRVSMNTLVSEVLMDLALPGTALVWDVQDLPDVTGDISTLRQVWTNLVANAVKYSSKKELPHIEIGSYPAPAETVFYIKDNGVGFDNRYKHKLFNVFQRLHRADEFEGTGVGLAIVSKIITRHGGKVWVDAEEGNGACFFFSLPDGIHSFTGHQTTSL